MMELGESTGFGLLHGTLEGETHPLLIDVFEDEADLRCKSDECVSDIYAPLNTGGETQLLRAIRKNDQQKIDVLLEAYRKDFEKVRNWLVSKHQWDVEDRLWFRKTILVATTEEQCKSVKRFESKLISKKQLRQAVFVVLQYPVDDENVAVLYPDETNRIAGIRLITKLTTNGFLSWNYAEKERETFMEAAAARGLIGVMKRLHELGAEIAIPEHNPLIQACFSNQKKTIEWLLNEHFDDFDCTLRSCDDFNALMAVMQKNNSKLFTLVLEKMIAYRVKYYNETKSQAFIEVLKFRSNDVSSRSSLIFLRKSPIQESIEKAVVQYELDLSHLWEDVPIVWDFISCQVALSHCFDYIKQNPGTLGIAVDGWKTILHEMIRLQYLDFLHEIYKQYPETKSHFNTYVAYDVMCGALSEENRDKMQFIMKHHNEFFKQNIELLKENVVCSRHYSKEYYEKRVELLKELFPDLQNDIEEARLYRHSEKHYYDGIEKSFADMNINLTDIVRLPVQTTRGSNGETLLHLAVEKDDIELFHQILDLGRDWIMDTLDNNGNHPVHFVQSVEMLNLIIEKHPDGDKLVHRINNDGQSVLHRVCALWKGSESLALLLVRVIECGANVHQLTNNGESAVFFTSNCSNLDILEKHSIRLDVVNLDGETALEGHLLKRNARMVRSLLCRLRDTPIFKQHAHKYLSPMMYLDRNEFNWDYLEILEKYPETTKMLFDSLVEHSREEASRIFAKACGGAFNFVAEKFLDGNYDLDYNFKNEQYDCTPIIGLMSYMEEPNEHIVKRLLEKRIDLTARDSWGKDALMHLVSTFRLAKSNGHSTGIVQLLLDHGAAIDTTDSIGDTLLHVALMNGALELVVILLENGADLKSQNNAGKTPLQMAFTFTYAFSYKNLIFFQISDDFSKIREFVKNI